MSRFRWSSLYSPTNKSKLAFKFWHPRVHDYCTILCSRPSCVSRNTNKLLQQFLCTSAKNFMLIIGSAPVNFFYFIFLLKTKESASLAWLFLHTGRWPACIESVFYWICGSRIFSLETLQVSSSIFWEVGSNETSPGHFTRSSQCYPCILQGTSRSVCTERSSQQRAWSLGASRNCGKGGAIRLGSAGSLSA